MAKKKAVHPVEDAMAKFLAIYDGLSRDQQRELENRMLWQDGLCLFSDHKLWLIEQGAQWKHETESLKRKGPRKKPNETIDQEVIRLHEEEGKTFGDIAKHIESITGKDCTYNAAAKRYHAAKKREPKPKRKRL